MKSIYYLIPLILLILMPGKSLAQCCAAGNPVSSNCSISDYGENVLSVSYSHIYSISDTYYSGVEKLDKKYIETKFNFSYISLSYGLSNKLRILADIGYFFNKTQNFVNLDYEKYAQGLGDLNLGLSYDSYQSDSKEFNISQSARLTLPVGEFNQVYDGIELPIDLQPSSGNYKYNLGIMLSKRFGESGFSLYSINSFELAQFVETSNSKYKYGNLYNLSLIGSYQIMDELSGRLQLRCEIRDKALNGAKDVKNEYSYSYINATGGFIAFVSPQLNYNFNYYKDWGLSLQFNFPFYKNVYGNEQLTNKYSIQAGISTSFNFSEGQEHSDIPKEMPVERDSKLLTTQISISGNCEMCKDRIEKVTNENKNVEASEWNSETKMLTIFYKDTIPDITSIEKSLADAGHDNDKFTADDAVYNKLPKCCHYRNK